MPGAEYKVLGKGVKAVRLWESIGPKWPQIAVLLLSKNEYKEFLKNPKKYLNELKLYGTKKTKKVHRCHLAHVSTHATYAVISKHQKDCTSVVSSSFGIPL